MKTKIIVPVLFALFFVAFVAALQFSLEEECMTTTIDESVSELYEVYIGTFENGTPEYTTRMRTVTVPRATTSCQQIIKTMQETRFTPTLQGYACTVEGNYAICDSTTDGNGDGICAPNGGETCCRIDLLTGASTCKNSEIPWVETKIPVRRLD